MSTLDREPRTNAQPSGMRALTERRVDPGVNATNPQRVDRPAKLAPIPPRVRGAQKGPIPR